MKAAANNHKKTTNVRNRKNCATGGVTPCPKCRSTKGLYPYNMLEYNKVMPQGLSCLLCGHWIDLG